LSRESVSLSQIVLVVVVVIVLDRVIRAGKTARPTGVMEGWRVGKAGWLFSMTGNRSEDEDEYPRKPGPFLGAT
jgi:hypothetical protein